MHTLHIENIRCFVNPASIPLRKLTFLVGDNSTGKTTVLAIRRLVDDCLRGMNGRPNFDEDPFNLGSYQEIANYRGGRWRAEQFSFGATFNLKVRSSELPSDLAADISDASFRYYFRKEGAYPKLFKIECESGPYRASILAGGGETRSSTISLQDREGPLPDLENKWASMNFESVADLSFLLRALFLHQRHESPHRSNSAEFSITPRYATIAKVFEEVYRSAFGMLRGGRARPIAFAPVRSRPRRTYDAISENPDSEGGHVPLVLAQAKSGGKDEWASLLQALNGFGKASGLFDSLEVKHLDSKDGGPFQIRIKYGGPAYNLADVGYGVSQSLPIVAESVRSPKGSTHLIQQPEVHLHPRGQAALGSLFVELAKKQNKTFIIETHSDYIIDRVRLEIRRGKSISHEDVVILFFERVDGSHVNIHPIYLNEEGHLNGAPDSYRGFFIEEEFKLLGV